MKTNREGIALIKKWEGCRLDAYPDPGTGGDPWTIGYGLTSAAGIVPVKKGMKITQEQADDYLVQSLVKYEAAVAKALTRNPNDNQFSAMVSLCYNIGPGAFSASTVVRRFNAGDAAGAADAFLMWTKGGGKVLPGLERRRRAERELFLSSVASSSAPTPPASQTPVTVPRRSVWAWFTALFSKGDA